MTEIELLILSLQNEMKKHQDPSKAENMAAYLKGHFKCFGIKSPVRNEIQRKWFLEVSKSNVDLWDLIYNLWSLDEREYHYVAIDLLNKQSKKFYKQGDHKFLRELITKNSWWDSVDSIASNAVGKYFQSFPEMIDEVITEWRNDEDMWLNRTCIIFQLKYRTETDFELLKDLIIQYLGVKEFFIQKAIGWSLRQYSKFNPNDVREFVNNTNLSGLANREASKYI